MILKELQKAIHIFERVCQLNWKKNKLEVIQELFQKRQQKYLNYKLNIKKQLKKIQLYSEHLLPKNKKDLSSLRFYN